MPQVIFCALLCIFTNNIHVTVKNSSAGTCLIKKNAYFLLLQYIYSLKLITNMADSAVLQTVTSSTQCLFPHLPPLQRPYITETMHSYSLPMWCLSGLGLSLLPGGAAVGGHSYHLGLTDTPPSSWDKQCPDSASQGLVRSAASP